MLDGMPLIAPRVLARALGVPTSALELALAKFGIRPHRSHPAARQLLTPSEAETVAHALQTP